MSDPSLLAFDELGPARRSDVIGKFQCPSGAAHRLTAEKGYPHTKRRKRRTLVGHHEPVRSSNLFENATMEAA